MTSWQYAALASLVDCIHALAMVVFFAGVPLLFVQRWPRLSFAYLVYAIVFVVVSQGSQLLLGHCFFTPLAGHLWDRSGWPVETGEWFTVRASRAIFHAAPSHHVIARLGDLAVVVTAIGAYVRLRARRLRTSVGRPTATTS